MDEAKEELKRKMKQIEMEKKEAARRASSRSAYPGSPGFASGMNDPIIPHSMPVMSGPPSTAPAAPAIHTVSRAGKGMKLGKKVAEEF